MPDPILVVDPHEEMILKLYRNRRLAHQSLFTHKFSSAPFHWAMIDRIHDKSLRAHVEVAFRGSAKSTRVEEGAVIRAGFRDFSYAVIAGASQPMAQKRLHAIRRHFEANPMVLELFGDLKGKPWTADLIETKTGITIEAIGRGQAIRGSKNTEMRPDWIILDDVEDKESVRTAENREKVESWFFTDLLPLGDEPTLKVTILSNDMHPDCLANRLDTPNSGFTVHRYPWVYLDEQGTEVSAWPERYSLRAIHAKKSQFEALGRLEEYNREYMCRSSNPEAKPFKKEMYKTEPRVRTWQPVYGAFDPARSIKEASAQTGHASWSWVGPRMVIWDAWGRKLMPDQIIDEIVRFDEDMHPVEIGLDEIGLHEFIRQPLRQRQVRLGRILPLRSLPAAQSKVERIRALQPFFIAREIEFAKPLPDLEKQLNAFPATGLRDILDALAYSLVMRAGVPIYEDFAGQHVMEGLQINDRIPGFLAMNAREALVTAVLLQTPEGEPRILADWMVEGEPAEIGPRIVQETLQFLGRMPKIILSPEHFAKYTNHGLAQAFHQKKIDIAAGMPPAQGREMMRELLRQNRRGQPAVMVSEKARFTLNGLAGGYCRAITKGGLLSEAAEENVYRILIEGLESFIGMMRIGLQDDDEGGINYQTTRDGRRYISAMVRR